jgi:AcrR family transcriptional regulator
MPSALSKTTVRGGELKRQAILEAALELFVARGFHGTAVPSVAEKAGVGAGTIYRYFANKEALVNELFREHKQAIARHVLNEFPFAAPAREQFRTFFHRIIGYARLHPRAFAFLELHSHADYLDDESRQVERQILEFGLRFFESTQAKGEIKQLEPMLMIGVLFGAIVGVVKLSWEHKLELTDAAVETAEQLCWEAIRA